MDEEIARTCKNSETRGGQFDLRIPCLLLVVNMLTEFHVLASMTKTLFLKMWVYGYSKHIDLRHVSPCAYTAKLRMKMNQCDDDFSLC